MLIPTVLLLLSLQQTQGIEIFCPPQVNSLDQVVHEHRITSEYGFRKHPISKDYRLHRGIDLAAVKGKAIYPLMSGIVIRTIKNKTHGKMVEIEHGQGIVTRYLHLNKIKVRPGQTVGLATRIGTVGSTGWATGPHLHLELAFLEHTINPRKVEELYKLVLIPHRCRRE